MHHKSVETNSVAFVAGLYDMEEGKIEHHSYYVKLHVIKMMILEEILQAHSVKLQRNFQSFTSANNHPRNASQMLYNYLLSVYRCSTSFRINFILL